MRQKNIHWVLVGLLVLGFLLVVVCSNGNKPRVIAQTTLPVSQIRGYALSNAPTINSQAVWSTNAPADVQYASVLRTIRQRFAATPTTHRSPVKPTATHSAEQGKALERLKQVVGDSLQVYLRSENATPRQLKGHPLARAVDNPSGNGIQQEQSARSFLEANASLLLLKDPKSELRLLKNESDPLGRSTLRFAQQYAGLEVWPARLNVHLDPQGNVDLVDGAYVPTPEGVSSKPRVTYTEAETFARAAVDGGDMGVATAPKLVIYAPLEKVPRLGWKIEVVSGITKDWLTVIDALDGSTLMAVNQCMDASVSGSGVDRIGITRSLNVWQSGSTYSLQDASKPMFNGTTGKGMIDIEDAQNATLAQIIPNNVIQNIYQITSSNPYSWNNPDGVSAAYNLSQSYDYYRTRHGRNSYDGQGGDITAIVRIASFPNASFNNYHKAMMFGAVDSYAASLDIIGHELTHGVTFNTAELQYEGQSGALNEAFSDIFGEMIEAYNRGTNDWIIGSQLASPNRNLWNPGAMLISGTSRPYPATYSEFIQPTDQLLTLFAGNDYGGVHINSTIIGHAYYLLSAGLKGAIGERDAERIFYQCLTQNLLPQSQFIDARLGCIAAAEILFGSNSIQAIKTAEAFDAVEIFAAPASALEPVVMNAAVNAPDSFMWVRYAYDWNSFSYVNCLYRFESALDSSGGRQLVTNIKVSRPSVSGNGQAMVFVGANEGMCVMGTSGSAFSTMWAGSVHSAAISPDARYSAFVFNASVGKPTNQIQLYDAIADTWTAISLKTPIQDGTPLNNISYADALDFSPDSKTLVYDALSSIRLADGKLRKAWSIFALNMKSLQQSVIIPPDPVFQIGNPSFAQTSSRYIVLDAQYTNGNTAICTYDLASGQVGFVGVSQSGMGYPCFAGDDSSVRFADADASVNSGRSIYRQLLSADKLSTSGNRYLSISDAKIITVYRRGTYTPPYEPPAITVTSPSPNAAFVTPVDVTLEAAASSPNGSITRVEFYLGSQRIATVQTAPFSYAWNNAPAGNYCVTARAYDGTGAFATSTPLYFTVRPPSQAGVFRHTGAQGFELSIPVPHSGLYRLEYSTNLIDWIPLGSYQCGSNLNYLDPAALNYPKCFYRAVLSQ